MCGIAGILDKTGQRADADLIRSMCAALEHRGPDDEGYYLAGPVGLGQRRLSIIDLPGGRQPLSNEDGSVQITFNGEIYNFQTLRDELQQQGHRFATRSDTEVIVHAYEQYGPACVERLLGMFAFALWDEKRRLLLLARDRVGKKPLFYAELAGAIVFASELQALVRHPALDRTPDPTAIDDYLTYGYIPAPKTIYRGVYKLPPAHYLAVRLDDQLPLQPVLYWQLDYTPKLRLDEREAEAALLAELTAAVRLRMIADVPVGALLSGGVDSSLVVALMSRVSGQRVKTFSIGFEDQAFNELPYARAVARRYDTDHHELIVRPDALGVLPTLVRHYGEPYADSSALPSYYLSQMARRQVKVVLDGNGGDECLAGYERHRGSAMADLYRRLPRPLRRGLIEPAASLIPTSLPTRHRVAQVRRFIGVAGQPLAQRYARWVSYLSPERKHELYRPDFAQQLAGYRAERWLYGQFAALARPGMSSLDAVLAVELRSYMPYDLLVKMDIAAMANSLEVRSPYLDQEVLAFCARLPDRFKLRGITMKYLLKKVGADLLPAENLHRRKAGFGIPLARWLREDMRPLLQDALLSGHTCTSAYLRQPVLAEMVRAHVSGEQDLSSALWALLCLELWHREFSPGR